MNIGLNLKCFCQSEVCSGTVKKKGKNTSTHTLTFILFLGFVADVQLLQLPSQRRRHFVGQPGLRLV